MSPSTPPRADETTPIPGSASSLVVEALSATLTAARKLSDFESLSGRLEASELAFHVYELDGKPGDQVRLRLTSEDFQVVAFVIEASSVKSTFLRMVTGGSERTAGSVEAQVPVTLPTAGTYRIVVTSLANYGEKRPVSTGEYRMTLLVDARASSFDGPESQRGTRFNAWESDAR